MTSDESKYQNIVNAATHSEGEYAVYLARNSELFDPSWMANSKKWCNSPLTTRLSAALPRARDAYPALVLHLDALLEGQVQPVVESGLMSDWKALVRAYPSASERLRARLA